MSEQSNQPSPALPARALPELLRRQFAAAQTATSTLLIATVAANPDSKHVTVTINGVNADAAKLTSYAAPVVGEPCYCIVTDGVLLALGSVR